MRIAVDLDDVVVAFVPGLLAAVKKEYDVDIPIKDIKEWNLHPILDPVIGRSWWAWLRQREWLWANFPAVDGAIGSIDQLRRDGHWVELLTSKPEWAEHNVYKFLGKWRPAFNRVTIVGPEDNKALFTDADILIDDKPQNCLEFVSTGRNAILFYADHNRYEEVPKGVYRAQGWREVMKIIREQFDG